MVSKGGSYTDYIFNTYIIANKFPNKVVIFMVKIEGEEH